MLGDRQTSSPERGVGPAIGRIEDFVAGENVLASWVLLEWLGNARRTFLLWANVSLETPFK
jgi:hypothetical protein